MPKRTSNSSVNSSIRQNTAATTGGFTQLLQLQQASNEYLNTIQYSLTEGQLAKRVAAIEEAIIARGSDNDGELGILRSIDDTLQSIAKSLKESVTASIITAGGSTSSSVTPTALLTGSKEDKAEAKQTEAEKDEILKSIEKNTRHKETSKAKGGEGGDGLGGLLGVFAAALGATVGAISGYIKSLKFFSSLLGGDKLLAGIKTALTEKFSSVIKFFDNIFDAIKAGFSSVKESNVLKKIVSTLSTILEPFISAFKTVSGFFGESKLFSSITEIFSKFGRTFKTFFTIAEKLFVPITIVMTLWDTVKGAIEGFEKDGIIGGIAGAIKGFFNSLIFGPVDMIKEAAAWVLGIFGFDEAKKTLESFSLEKIFSSLVDAIFAPVQTFKAIMGKFGDFLNSLKGFTIPEFAFTIPVINKKVSIGPFKPFGEAEAKQANDVTGSSNAVTADNVKPLTPSSVAPSASTGTSNIVAAQSGAVSSLKETSAASMTTVVAPSVNNNMQQTQVAKIDAPVRSNDSSLDRYFSARAVY